MAVPLQGDSHFPYVRAIVHFKLSNKYPARGDPMYEFMIEAILIATFIVPLAASSMEPARAVTRSRVCLLRKLRRNH